MELLDQMIDDLSEDIEPPKRVIGSGFESESKLNHVKPDLLSRGQKRRMNRKPERTLDIEEKLALDGLKLRDTLDPSRFYKKNATENISTNFQIGTIIEDPIDYYASRATRKERKQTLIDELIDDSKQVIKKRFHRLRATDAIKKREKALADRRKMLQGKKKKDRIEDSGNKQNKGKPKRFGRNNKR